MKKTKTSTKKTTRRTTAKASIKAKKAIKNTGTQKCCCGCGELATKNFKPGHDAKLKSILLQIHKGILPTTAIPAIAKERRDSIKFMSDGIYKAVMDSLAKKAVA